MDPAVVRGTVVLACPGGPLLVRGETEVVDADGERHTSPRPLTAVCRCARSTLAPWCDGSHKVGARPPG